MPRTSYADQPEWRTIADFLPNKYRLTDETVPDEEWWEHDGHHIHLDTYRNPDAAVKVIAFHGVGTNGRQMSTILGRPLAERGFETIAIDMPTFGVTQVAPGAVVTYDDWVRIGSDLVDAERADDDRPIVLYGLSAGGMEAFHIASVNRQVAGVVGMTFLDQSSRAVRIGTAIEPATGFVGASVMKALAQTPARRVRVPMRAVSKMRALVNDRAAKKACYADRTSAGNLATVAFLDSYLNYEADIAPDEFDVCPILLTRPAADRWSPLSMSQPFVDRITRVPVETVMLENAGHYPLEQPGLDQLVDAVADFAGKVTGR
ncbi:alpha/beta fold hydrolase [Gordonia sp. HY285]|uniref:alpha/beta hydrolase n=1 Tax=Gordonia liuliyuniae TaxID=2911517 RepID=UPI001F399C4C|nr:alpha/beta fold hydrolase [Gordonia liuliyuniae]MCF8610298.1 alpha/beta fold hydrolase [Gordonia liuliyuniae]